MSTSGSRPNFYILLNVRPDEKWDEVKFEQALRDKRIEWSRQGSGISKKALVAKQSLALIPEMQRVMRDPALRDAEAKAAQVELVANHKANLELFERELMFLNAKEYLEQSELDAFLKEFSSILPEKEIKARVKVPVKSKMATAAPTTAPQLDPTIAKAISEKLVLLRVVDLYALLGRPDSTARSELLKAADQLYNDTLSRQPKTAEVTAQSELAGHARIIFKTEELHKRYNETLRQSSLNALLKDLEKSVNRSTEKEVHERQVQTFLLEAQKAGWSEEVARNRLKEVAHDRGWLQLPVINVQPRGLRCGNCHEMNEVGDTFCRYCKRELMTICSSCHSKVATDDAGCGKCGFPVGNRYWVDTLLDRATISRDPAQIRELLSEAEELWKPKDPDVRTKKILELKADLQQRIQEQQRILKELLHLIDERRFYEAQRFLLSHTHIILEQEAQRQTIEHAIAEARELLRQAQVSGVSRAKCIELCRQALHKCTDYKEARDFLKTMPPPAPDHVQATVGGIVVHLSWTPLPIDGITYRVVCKNHAHPNSASDGKVVATVSGQTYDDETPEIGLPLYYAVFSELENVLSDAGAVLAKPLLLTADVEHLTVSADHQKVRLSWQVPIHVHAVIIIRKEGMRPKTMLDGTKVATYDHSQKEFFDRDVQDGHIYYYGIYCQYKNHEGHLIASPGKIERVSPERPPAFITHLDFQEVEMPIDQELRIRWQLPTKGTVVIIKSNHPLSHYECKVIDKSRLGSLGEKLENLPDMVTDKITGSSLVYYTPVVIFQNSLYVGRSHRYVHVDDVTQLVAQNLGAAIRLKWHWPKNCQEVLISFSVSDWPHSGEVGVTTSRVRREEYERLGYYDLKGIIDDDHYIVVCAVIIQGDEAIIAQGVRTKVHLAPKLVITYEIKKPTFFNKHYTLQISARTPGTLPAMVLSGKRDMLPLNKDDGTQLQRIGPKRLDSKKLVLALTKQTFPRGMHGKLFLEDDSMYDFVDVHHPGEDKLRLY